MLFIRVFLIFGIILSSTLIHSQRKDSCQVINIYKELPDDIYVPIDKSTMLRSPAYRYRNGGFFTSQVNIDSEGYNIVGDAANEPSIAIDPTNPDRIVIGWRQFDTVDNNFRQAGFGYSLDGGVNWTFPGVLNPGIFQSDPVLDFDIEGNFYYNSLGLGYTVNFNINDGGMDWDGPFYANGGDKQWIGIDRSDGIGTNNYYSFWTRNSSSCASGEGSFTRSFDGGVNFESCSLLAKEPIHGTMAVNGSGDLYVFGRSILDISKLVLLKSSNAKDSEQETSWDSVLYVDLDAAYSISQPINPEGLTGQNWVAVDQSNDNVYVLASAIRVSINDPADVMFAKSIDGGQSFSAPQRINTDGIGNYNWFGTLSVAPNGRIDVIWLDTRNALTGTNDSELYYSYSEDQGESWSDNEALSISFDPNIGYPQQEKMGDYFDMVSTDLGVHLAWANTINGEQDVYYSFIPPETILDITDNELSSTYKFISVPNPFLNETQITFSVIKQKKVTINVYNLLGEKVSSILNETVYGLQNITWNGTDDNGNKLQSGLYFMSLNSEDYKESIKIIIK